ncbi:MAG: hypothetical protein LBQ54_04105 [Planctomycetaceae bacterium]|nr:hypothetical protein [Planctomycetaceae bacterium]
MPLLFLLFAVSVMITDSVSAQYVPGGNAVRSYPQPGGRPGSPQPGRPVPQPPQEPPLVTNDIHQTIQNLLAVNSRRIPNTADSLPSDLLAYCFVYGLDAMTYTPAARQPQSEPIYAVGALCWNFPCRSVTMLRASSNHVFAKVGYGCQPQPGAFLAMLGLSEIAPDYEMKVNNREYTIIDLIKSEQYQCSRRMDLSMVLVGLAGYLTPKEEWTNRLNETWNIQRIVTEELARRPDQNNAAVTNQLLGFAAAVRCYERNHIPLDKALMEASDSLEEYQKFAFSIQNPSGLWHPLFFSYKGDDPNADATLYASAHIVRFLVYSLPEDQLSDARMSRAVTALASRAAKIQANVPLGNMSDLQVGGLTTALHALKIYDERLNPK